MKSEQLGEAGRSAPGIADANLVTDVKFIASQLLVEADEIEATRHPCAVLLSRTKRDTSEVLQAALDNAAEATGPQRSDSGAPNPTQVTDPSLVSDTPDATSLVPVSGELEREWDNDA